MSKAASPEFVSTHTNMSLLICLIGITKNRAFHTTRLCCDSWRDENMEVLEVAPSGFSHWMLLVAMKRCRYCCTSSHFQQVHFRITEQRLKFRQIGSWKRHIKLQVWRHNLNSHDYNRPKRTRMYLYLQGSTRYDSRGLSNQRFERWI